MSRLLIACLLAAGMVGFADDTPMRVRAYILNSGVREYAASDVVYSFVDGKHKIVGWSVPGVAKPTAEDLAAVENPSLGHLPDEELVKDGGKYRAKTSAEKNAAVEAKVPTAVKKLYNRYIRICHEVLVIAGDPRASQLPHVALSLADLHDVMEAADSKMEAAGSKNADEAKNAEKQLNKVSRQLIPVLIQLSKDPNWEASIFESDVGE